MDSALWGQSTTSGPNRRNEAVISSDGLEKRDLICAANGPREHSNISMFQLLLPSSMSGGRPPTNTLREYRSWLSEPTECGEERAGELSGKIELSMYPPASSGI